MTGGLDICFSNIRENNMRDHLRVTGYLRIWQILGDPKSDPPIPPILPISRSTWWSGVKSGRYPKPVELSTRCTAWKVEDIRKPIAKLNDNNDQLCGDKALLLGCDINRSIKIYIIMSFYIIFDMDATSVGNKSDSI